MPNYFVRNGELWIEVDQQLLEQIINDPRIKVVLNGKLYFVIKLGANTKAPNLPIPIGGVST